MGWRACFSNLHLYPRQRERGRGWVWSKVQIDRMGWPGSESKIDARVKNRGIGRWAQFTRRLYCPHQIKQEKRKVVAFQWYGDCIADHQQLHHHEDDIVPKTRPPQVSAVPEAKSRLDIRRHKNFYRLLPFLQICTFSFHRHICVLAPSFNVLGFSMTTSGGEQNWREDKLPKLHIDFPFAT